MIYLQPITFYAILREMPDGQRTEIAEHPDGAMKAYAEQFQANDALALMDRDEGWRVDEILMVPPPMTADHRREAVKREVAELMNTGPAPRAKYSKRSSH